MKRDMDLCRKILLEVESWDTTVAPRKVQIDGYTEDQIGHHAWLLADGGLVEGVDATGLGVRTRRFMPRALTYEGHEFLDAARNQDRWEQVKQKAAAAGTVGFTVIKALLIQSAKDALGLGGGGGGGGAD